MCVSVIILYLVPGMLLVVPVALFVLLTSAAPFHPCRDVLVARHGRNAGVDDVLTAVTRFP